ncbi:hypothetical protein Tco_0508421 [Tanacetum coccineum]
MSSHRLCQVFIRHEIMKMRIRSLLIPNIILSMIFQVFSPTLHNSSLRLTCVSYVEIMLIMFPVNYPPQETSREILQAQEDLMEAIQAFLKEYDHKPPNEKSMALLLSEERFLKIKQVMRKEQNQPEVMKELLLKLMDDFQILKGSQQEKKETTAQSSIPYWNSSMIDDEEARDNFLKDVCTFLRKFSQDIQELMSKLLEDVRNISEEFLEYINCPSWNRPLFYFDDDDDEYTVIWRRPKAITLDEPSEEREDPLIMGEKELSTIPEKYQSSFEDLDPIPSESKGISDDICDNDHSNVESLLSQVILITSPMIDFLFEEFVGELAPILSDFHEADFDEEEDICDDDTSSDDDDFEDLEYFDATPPNSKLVSLEEVEDIILHDKLSNVYLLISKIEALNDNPTLSSFSNSDNSFSDHTEETRSGSTTTHANNSLPEYDSSLFEIEPDQGGLTSIVISDDSNDPLLELPEFESFHFDLDPSFPCHPPEPPDVEISLIIETNAPVINNVELNKEECFNPWGGEIDFSQNDRDDDSFTFVIWIFLPYLTYPKVSPLLSSTKNEDTIFDLGIFT